MSEVYDYNTEDCVLGAVMRNVDEHDNIAKYITNIDIFGRKCSKILWEKITDMKRASKMIDLHTVCSSLTKSDISSGCTKHYVSLCYSSAPAKGAAEYYATMLYEKFLMRKVAVQSEIVKEKATSNNSDVYDVISDAHSLFGELLEIRPSKAADINDVISEALYDINNKTSKLIKTDYDGLDKFAGGLTRGEITIVGGRPGHGKTTVLINLLSRVLEQGYRAVFFSRELPNSELLKKIICLESCQLSYTLVRKNVYSENQTKILNSTISKVKEKYSKDNFLMFDNIKDFAGSASEVKKFKPDVIFDDYIQLIASNGKEEQRRLQVEKICNDYKWLAKESNSVVVLASQLNRGIESMDRKYEPKLSDLAESGAIEQVAENVFFTHYDYKVKGEAGKVKNVLTLSAKKIRYGDTGFVDLGYDGDKCKIYNSIEELIANDKDEIPF